MTMSKLPIEVLFAQKLASNEPKIRDRAVKKLSSWLRSRNTSDDAMLTPDEMMRIWKGLHYCFWMSDKMMVQEELAEKISALVHIFGSRPESAVLFISSGLTTLGREWLGIDKLRMDKFMMLVRRFLRQIFVYLAKDEWKNIQGVLDVFEKDVIDANKSIKDFRVSLGFQLHFTDVYLEELAKIGGEEMPDHLIRQCLQPFINQLRDGNEERLKSHIEERIFHHLMRQSDVGIAHEQEDEYLEDEMLEEEEEQAEEIEEGSDDEEDMDFNAPKDPRAGRVDVTIPQLMVDYEKLAEQLFQAGNDQKVWKKNRRKLYNLTKQFRALHNGKYPLAPDFDGGEDIEEVEPIQLGQAIRRKEKESLQEIETLRKERQDYRQALKRKRSNKEQEDTADPETGEDNVVYESSEEEDHDDEVIEPVPKKQKTEKVKKNKKKLKKEVGIKNSTAKTESPGKKQKKKKLSMNSSIGTEDSKPHEKQESVDVDNDHSEPMKKKKKKVRSPDTATNGILTEEKSPTLTKLKKKEMKKLKLAKKSIEASIVNKVKPMEKLDKKPKVSKLNKTNETLPESGISGFEPPTILASPQNMPLPKFFRKSASKSAQKSANNSKMIKKPPLKVTQSEPRRKSKRINFAMTCNKYQSTEDHSASIMESPDIPFVPEKKPKQGLLKNKNDISIVNTPSPLGGMKQVQKNTLINGKTKSAKLLNRMYASDFF